MQFGKHNSNVDEIDRDAKAQHLWNPQMEVTVNSMAEVTDITKQHRIERHSVRVCFIV